MKRILIAVLCFALVGVTGTLAATVPVSPIVDASWATILVDENGVGDSVWYTDKGWLNTDSQPFIKDGRLMVSFRWATEIFGGSATWQPRKDGTTESVTLFAPPVQTLTVTQTITVPEYIYVTKTVTVPALLPTLKLVKPSAYLTVVPTATISFWGLAPVGNDGITILAGNYPNPNGSYFQMMSVVTDFNGYFEGSFTLPVDAAVGTWKVTAIQRSWASADEYFVVLAP